jgi:hypothetical protein
MRKGFTTLATLAVLLALAVPAQAKVIGHEHYTQPYSDDFEECGFPVHLEGLATGNARLRVGLGDLDTAFFQLDNYRFSETWTNTDNGRQFTIWGDAVIRDVKATHVSGSIFKFTTVESGRPFNIVDANGTTLVRDRGAIRTTYLFDTQGDNTPGGIFLDTLEQRVSGPHPGFDLTEDEFCAIVGPLLS